MKKKETGLSQHRKNLLIFLAEGMAIPSEKVYPRIMRPTCSGSRSLLCVKGDVRVWGFTKDGKSGFWRAERLE